MKSSKVHSHNGEVATVDPAPDHRDERWLALAILCLGVLMIVLDTTIVNVALPSSRTDLSLSETSLAWLVNTYLLCFGGFLLTLRSPIISLCGAFRSDMQSSYLFTIPTRWGIYR